MYVLYVYMYVCMYVCVFVFMYVCISMKGCIYVRTYVRSGNRFVCT